MYRFRRSTLLRAGIGWACAIAVGCSGAAPPTSSAAEPPGAPGPPSSPGAEADMPEASADAEPMPAPSDAPDDAMGSADEAGDSAGAPDEANLSDGETRTMKVIQQLVLDNRDRFRGCYDKVQAKVPELQGDLTLYFVLDAQGKVREAALNEERSTLKHPEVTKCVIFEIKNLKFPASSKGLETKVNYPFNFNPK